MLNRVQQIQPRLIVTNKQALKELESAGLRGKALEKYSVTLPSELQDSHSTGHHDPNPEVLKKLSDKYPNMPSDDLLNATLLVQGAFGDGARVVGLPPELSQEAEWLMMERNQEKGMSSRALSSEDLTSEMLPKKSERDVALQAIQDERGTGKVKKGIKSIKKSVTSKGVERQWDRDRVQQRRQNVEIRDQEPLSERDQRVQERNQLTDYYDKLARIAIDPNHPHAKDALDTMARDRYEGALEREQEEVVRQMKFLRDSGVDPNSISSMNPNDLRDPNGFIRKFGIDEDIAKRAKDMDDYNNPDTDLTQKQAIERQIVHHRHQTGAGNKRGDSMNHVLVEHDLRDQVGQRMMEMNDERYPQKQIMKNRRRAMVINNNNLG